MLPLAATEALGLGLAETSPALSFGLTIGDDGAVTDVEITPSWVRVTRLTYEQAETQLAEPPFGELDVLMQAHAFKRLANGAIELKLPEVKIRRRDDEIVIKPLPLLRSRELVREAMLLTGVAVAHYAQLHNLAVPYSTQEPPQVLVDITDGALSSMFAQRRQLKPAQQKSAPRPEAGRPLGPEGARQGARHTGLGLDAYVQSTSPLRRYGDLLTHQQLRAHLRGETPLDTQAVMLRMAEASAAGSGTRRAERLSNTHWKLVYLLRHPEWTGDGVVVEKAGARNLVVIPEMDLETEIHGRPDLPLDGIIRLGLNEVNLPALETKFRVIKNNSK
jgi:exoribonuclease-2